MTLVASPIESHDGLNIRILSALPTAETQLYSTTTIIVNPQNNIVLYDASIRRNMSHFQRNSLHIWAVPVDCTLKALNFTMKGFFGVL